MSDVQDTATQFGDTVAGNAESVGTTAESDAGNVSSAYGSGGVLAAAGAVGDDAESGVADLLSGGNLQKAYLLILPASNPAGGAAAAALGAAGIAAEDLTGSSGGATSSGAANAAETTFSGTVGNRLDFMFNPKSYTVEKSGEWKHEVSPGARPTAVPVWKGSSQRTMSMEMLFDTAYQKNMSVQANVELLFSCLQPTVLSMLKGEPSPPFVMFGWGENLAFLAYLSSVKAEYQRFLPNGTPTRVMCNITMKEIPIGRAGQNPTSGGNARRSRRLVAGDTLQSVATHEYGKPTMWRAIANANGIEDPTRVAPGTTVLIPPRSEAASIS